MLKFTSLYGLFSHYETENSSVHPDIRFEVTEEVLSTPTPKEIAPKSISFFDFYGKMLVCNMGLSAVLTTLASPFERARTLVQADLASLSSVQQFDASRGPITPGVQAERPLYSSSPYAHINQVYNRQVVAEPARQPPLFPSAYEHYYNSVVASQRSGKKPPVVIEPRWDSIGKVLRQAYSAEGVQGLFRGNGVLQMANVTTQMTGCNLLVPLVLMQVFGKKFSQDPEEAMLASHLAAHLHLYLGMYPIFSTLTRFYGDKNFLYPQLPRDHPTVREFIATMARNEASANTTSAFLRFRSRVRARFSPEKRFFQKPLTRVLERVTAHDGRKGLFRGGSVMAATLGLYAAVYAPIFALSSPAITHAAMQMAEHRGIVLDTLSSDVLIASTVLAPALLASTLAQYAIYPLTTLRTMVLNAENCGYVSYVRGGQPITAPVALSAGDTTAKLAVRASTWEAMGIAAREVLRQDGVRGFFRGASVIPLVRVPQVAVGSLATWKVVAWLWPENGQLINPKHYTQIHSLL